MTTHLGTLQRRVETVLVEFKRSRNTWNELNVEGFPAANKLINTVIQSKYSDDLGYWHPSLRQEFPNIIQKYDIKLKKLIEQDDKKVMVILERMAKQQIKMMTFIREFIAIQQRVGQVLENDQIPLFKTCPIHVFVQRSKIIIDMYTQELYSKQLMVQQGMKEISNQEEGLALLSAWQNQPSICEKTIQEFEDICNVELDLL
ncbi:uncharacterized protein BX664DRAFT_328287 [Halteromyces radiatus]|uniref:uncharacterized protein n=1 Tax=Halteromyces radiatus TaxID=101107 RepID=UPI00221F7C3D|nr:uncharacterized protein BX664DRAFT_328287 [Halteromyces radiatus]KAI8092841.1 hypothetical protein BX664DRAFT_328287 [Halteromyces radiatus]